jgi:GH43 family beta-xylosidase
MINMSIQEFIKLEARALDIIRDKDSNMVWRAVECGAMEKVRLYAESHNYDVSLDDVIVIIWSELCSSLAPRGM